MFFKPVYILILVFTIIIDYYAGQWIYEQKDQRKKKWLLVLSIVANAGVLIFFKYFNFLAENLNEIFHSVNTGYSVPYLTILLPIGLSFHTFQAMSYTIEVYRGNQMPERHFGIYALYVMFYPQLVAGPIERPQNILHQFHEEKKFNYENARTGLILMGWGLFKKVVIADRLSSFVNQVYGDVHSYTGISLILATIAFAFQIFCDFSGYSDIAIGSARFMGYDLMTNFDRPYRATSISEFWRRWHISLSTWFRDYVYIPLGGNRVSTGRRYFNLFLVFMLSGVWHGANWTFVIWGMIHGTYLIVESKLYSTFPSLEKPTPIIFKRFIVFILVCIAWIFFRATSLSDAMYVLNNLTAGIPAQIRMIITNEQMARLHMLYLGHSASDLVIVLFFIAIMMIIHVLQKDMAIDEWLVKKTPSYRWGFYYLLVASFLFFGVFNSSGFIYFQF